MIGGTDKTNNFVHKGRKTFKCTIFLEDKYRITVVLKKRSIYQIVVKVLKNF